MNTAVLKDVAPARAARLSFLPKDVVWQLNLDQVEAQSGRILSKVTGLASAAGSSTQAFDTGNVLYSKLRPYLNKVVCPDSPGIATTELVPLRPDPKQLDRQYLTYYLRSPEFVTWISNEVAGAKMPRVTMKVFWDHEIPLPPPRRAEADRGDSGCGGRLAGQAPRGPRPTRRPPPIHLPHPLRRSGVQPDGVGAPYPR